MYLLNFDAYNVKKKKVKETLKKENKLKTAMTITNILKVAKKKANNYQKFELHMDKNSDAFKDFTVMGGRFNSVLQILNAHIC